MNLSPSLMCADPGHFAEEIAQLEAAGSDSFHIDIMDGEFVPNFALSWAEVSKFRSMTAIPFEAHLMVKNLDIHIRFAKKCGIHTVFIHADHPDAKTAIKTIRDLGMSPGIAITINVQTEMLKQFCGSIDKILFMRVNPGFAGQKQLENVDYRIDEIRKIFNGVPITADGAVSIDVIQRLAKNNVSGFVLGTSSLFNKDKSYRTIIHQIKSGAGGECAVLQN